MIDDWLQCPSDARAAPKLILVERTYWYFRYFRQLTLSYMFFGNNQD